MASLCLARILKTDAVFRTEPFPPTGSERTDGDRHTSLIEHGRQLSAFLI